MRTPAPPLALVGDKAILGGDVTLDLDLIPALGVADIIDRYVVVLTPDEWHTASNRLRRPNMLSAAVWP
jgi:hypothetical protein